MVPDAAPDAARLADVRAHLDVLLDSDQFRDTTRMKRFLSYIVDEALAGRGERLKGYSIGLEVFDRPESFDPQTDTIVRVQAGQLRRRLDLYYSKAGRDDPVRIVVPRGGYVPVFEFREAQQEGNGDGDATADTPPAPQAAAPPPMPAPLASRLRGPDGRPGIIVLTFTDLSLSDDRDYFAEGLTAELVNALVQFRYLRVVTRTASVTSSGPELGVRALAERHQAEFVLTGNIRHAGENLRVSVNLIDATSGQHIYSKIFDRRYTPRNLFDIQDEIASYVAASVGAPFGAITRHHRRALPDMPRTAYEAILRYYEMNLAPSRTKAAALREDVREVIAQTPGYSVPWAIGSLLDSFLFGQTLERDALDAHLDSALRSARKAVRLNSDSSLGWMALFLAEFYSGSDAEYEAAAARCVELNGNDAAALAYLAITRAFLGDLEDAHALHDRAVDLLPRPPRWFGAVPGIEAVLSGHHGYVLSAIGRVSPRQGVWSQMLGLAALGHLNRPRVSAQLLDALRDRHPDYDAELHACFLRWRPHDRLREVTEAGWRAAGLEI